MKILIVISLLAVITWLLGIIFDKEDAKIGGVISLLFIALIGWGIIGNTMVVSSKLEPAPIYEIIKGKHVCVVTAKSDLPTDKKIKVYNGSDIDLINDSTEFLWNININMYGSETSRELILKIKK